ncbi:hypothetical protein [Roseateles amylovorans]|uniref:DUF4760 domain-containing protein n=1 Tax=Roseateles amylovorans TaxID=2978473 RepID=A0ABY6B423_9BURK|nr:hypothetical protein [Roseateles amylovorans]UXH79994.1 hypothetical protein N4261_08980 [Roseateles amylovorans]
MDTALIGLVGVLIGALLAEHFRRRNLIDAYSQKIFERRLEIYEGLMALVQSGHAVASDVMSSESLTKEERHAAISEAILAIAEYTDENALYIDSEVAANSVAMLMGAEGIQDIEDETERAAEIAVLHRSYKTAKHIILEESGIRQINKHLKIVSKSKPDSPVIRRIRELERDAS